MGSEQTSGSITFDTGSLTAGVLAAITPVLDQVNQAIDQINTNITVLGERIGSADVSRPAAVRVIADSLPAGLRCEQMGDGGSPLAIAHLITENLEQNGYRLTKVVDVMPHTQPVPRINTPIESPGWPRAPKWFNPGTED